MKILSIAWFGSCSTVALMVEGRIVACLSEERLSRIKNDVSYPIRSIESVLKTSDISSKELDLVVMPGERFDAVSILCHKLSGFSIQDRLKEQKEYWYPKLIQGKSVSFLDLFKDKIDTAQYPGDWNKGIDFLKNGKPDNADTFFQEFRRQAVSRHLGIDPKKVIFTNHHRSHAYYAYYGSPMEKSGTLVLTADAWGDDMNASVSIAEGRNIKVLSTSQNFIIGRLYRYITLLLGMKPDEHEYKVMGLAAYAKDDHYKEVLAVFEKTMGIDKLKFVYNEQPSDLYFYFKDKLEGYRFDSIAGAIQKYTENILTEWVRNSLEMTGTRRVCFGGGVAMNIKAIMEIASLKEVDDLFICPSPSDESLAIGAAYVIMHDYYNSRGEDPALRLLPLSNAYLGPAAVCKEAEIVADKAHLGGYRIKKAPDEKYIAKHIASGSIIARCMGRSEFGARALGNRSILADPRNTDVVKVINDKIKKRDFWMPFAPSILEESADKYLINPKSLKAPYMTVAFDTKPPARKDIKAALHQYDFSVRPQIVDKETNPEYHKLISEFNKLTGVGALLNTSFNIHGEPIVQTPLDAFDVFERSVLDGLILDNYLIEREG